jgi:predicted SprT family Zn-dependent metalloprotease
MSTLLSSVNMVNGRHAWAIARAAFWWRRCHEAYDVMSYGPVPPVKFTRSTVRAGMASIGMLSWTYHIELSNHFLYHEGDKFDETIGHEVAHVFASLHWKDDCGHDWRWQTVMRRIGLSDARCHNYTSVVRRGRRASTKLIPCKCGKKVKIGANVAKKIKMGEIRTSICCGFRITPEMIG